MLGGEARNDMAEILEPTLENWTSGHSEIPTYQELGLRILVVLMKGVSALSDSTFCFCAAASLYKSSVALKGDTDEALLSSRD
jgi:hypothetical protein